MWPWSRNPGKLKRHTYGNEKFILNRVCCPVIRLGQCWLQGKYWTNTRDGRNVCPLLFLHWCFWVILMHVLVLLLKNMNSNGSYGLLFSFLLIYNNVFYFIFWLPYTLIGFLITFFYMPGLDSPLHSLLAPLVPLLMYTLPPQYCPFLIWTTYSIIKLMSK